MTVRILSAIPKGQYFVDNKMVDYVRAKWPLLFMVLRLCSVRNVGIIETLSTVDSPAESTGSY